ncbi:MAG: glycosyltransferase [Acidobacteria bacterium]|nr:glycosyltransferase [Acidobacteriota bacterium]
MGDHRPVSQKGTACVSIIIPTYNAARFLPAALESIFRQDYPSYEVIAVDDGSTDETAAVLQPFADRIILLRQPNAGVSAARNRGLAAARGEWVVFLDADDQFLPGKLTDQIAIFTRRQSLAMVQSGWQLVDENDHYLRTIEPWRLSRRLDLETWLLWKPVFPGAMMFRRRVVQQVGGFDENLRQAEDVDLVLRIALAGGTGGWLRKPTVRYRLHGGNTIRNGWQQARDLNRVMDMFFAHPSLPRRLRRREAYYRYYTLTWLAWQLHCTGGAADIGDYLRQSLDWIFHYPDRLAVLVNWSDYLADHCRRDERFPAELSALWPIFRRVLHFDDTSWRTAAAILQIWLSVWHPLQRGETAAVIAGLQSCPVQSLDEFVTCSVPIARFSDHTTVQMVSRLRRLLRQADWGRAGPGYQTTPLYWAAFLEALHGRRMGKAFAGFWRAALFGLHPRAFPYWRQYLREVRPALRSAWLRTGLNPELLGDQENPRG